VSDHWYKDETEGGERHECFVYKGSRVFLRFLRCILLFPFLTLFLLQLFRCTTCALLEQCSELQMISNEQQRAAAHCFGEGASREELKEKRERSKKQRSNKHGVPVREREEGRAQECRLVEGCYSGILSLL
jgi:hypothetical protein